MRPFFLNFKTSKTDLDRDFHLFKLAQEKM